MEDEVGIELCVAVNLAGKIKTVPAFLGTYNDMFFSDAWLSGDIIGALTDYTSVVDTAEREGQTHIDTPCGVRSCRRIPFGPVDTGLVYVDIDKRIVRSLMSTADFTSDTPLRYPPYHPKYKSLVMRYVNELEYVIPLDDSRGWEAVDSSRAMNGSTCAAPKGWSLVEYPPSVQGVTSAFRDVFHLVSEPDVDTWRQFARKLSVPVGMNDHRSHLLPYIHAVISL